MLLRNILHPLAGLLLTATSHAQLADPEGRQAPQAERATATSTQAALPASNAHTSATLTYVITNVPNGTFGYDILSNGKLFVRQQNIPGQPGTSGCATRGDAENLAQLIISKIKQGMMPPTVTKEELNALSINRK